MAKRPISSVLPTKITIHEKFSDLSISKKKAIISKFGSIMPNTTCEHLFDSWRDILLNHEAKSYGAIYGMDAIARTSNDEQMVEDLFRLIRRSCIVLKSFTAIEDYGFSTKIRDYCAGRMKGDPDLSDEWAQALLTILSRAPADLLNEPAFGSKRPRGRPAIAFRYQTSDQLIVAWRSHGLPGPPTSGSVRQLLSFYDEVASGVEFQFHAAWGSHTLSPRWPEIDKEVLTAPEKFSIELDRLRTVLGKRARSGGQPAAAD